MTLIPTLTLTLTLSLTLALTLTLTLALTLSHSGALYPRRARSPTRVRARVRATGWFEG